MRVRLSARSRLALLYTALVLAAGTLMTALTYVLMRRKELRLYYEVRPAPGASEPAPPPRELPEIADEARDAALSDLLTQAPIALAVVTLLAAALAWLVAGRVLRPIRVIADTAQRLSAENLSERVPVTTPADELAALAGTINGMLDRIQRGIAERDRVLESQRMFTANAAHELRTPLTTMRTAIEVTLDGDPTLAELLTMARDIGTAVEHSQRTLDGLLALAHSQAGPRAHRRTDLAAVAARLLTDLDEEAAARHIALLSGTRPAPVTGEPILLERLVGNLIDNAVRHNHPHGQVAVTTGTAGGHAFLRVANTGRPITPEAANGLLEPFVRGTGAPLPDQGAGLGLSIVQAIVAAHDGELIVAPRPAGGLDITVRFPQVPAVALPA
ncbi:sensor histidine kinase [Streptomyces litchfieldiae]|uniref:histidine kinase n=1 Tax=Streptomyces litchfieldiae TaxID=3075543 RepID=A0ABU2MM40_9ACTN|nr:HAMP domain-containing sensor histidine kinase [Streptomyces sp. DSM 44938]MDT0342682.1 HAMP domain-containing sensor histidine kinase [Streptomyces sp. DSM 44938]